MRVTLCSYDLRAWRTRMGMTQMQAAEAVGLSKPGYCQHEYRNAAEGQPLARWLALLCWHIEERAQRREAA